MVPAGWVFYVMPFFGAPIPSLQVLVLLMLSSQEALSILRTISMLTKNIEKNRMKTHNLASLKTVFCIITSVLINLKR